MATLINIQPTKTYKTPENAKAAVEKHIAPDVLTGIRYFIHRDEATGRYFPIFIGAECLQHGIHFRFNIIG